MGILEVLVKPRPQKIGRILQFVHPERTFFKHSMEVDVTHPLFVSNTPDIDFIGIVGMDSLEQRHLYACSSDPEMMCEARTKVN